MKLAFYLPDGLFDSLYPNAPSQGWGIWSNKEARGGPLGLAKLGIDSASWVSQREILNLSMAIFERTFAITGALNVLTLLVAAAAIFISLLAVYQYRRPEYALWRALGITWAKFFYVAGAPVFFISAVSMAFSLPVGLALSWLLIEKINVIFGWTMPLVVVTVDRPVWAGRLCCSYRIWACISSAKSALNESLKELGAYERIFITCRSHYFFYFPGNRCFICGRPLSIIARALRRVF